MTKRTKSAILLITIVAGVFGLALARHGVHHGPSSKGIFRKTQPAVEFGKPYIKASSAKSSVCTKLASSVVANIVKEPNDGPVVTTPDTKTNNGSVAGCSYITSKSVKTPKVRYVSATVRSFTSTKSSASIFKDMNQAIKRTTNSSGQQYFYNKTAKQLVALKDSDIITVSIVGGSKSSLDVQAMALALSQKL